MKQTRNNMIAMAIGATISAFGEVNRAALEWLKSRLIRRYNSMISDHLPDNGCKEKLSSPDVLFYMPEADTKHVKYFAACNGHVINGISGFCHNGVIGDETGYKAAEHDYISMYALPIEDVLLVYNAAKRLINRIDKARARELRNKDMAIAVMEQADEISNTVAKSEVSS